MRFPAGPGAESLPDGRGSAVNGMPAASRVVSVMLFQVDQCGIRIQDRSERLKGEKSAWLPAGSQRDADQVEHPCRTEICQFRQSAVFNVFAKH